jgi:hypothetical protein
MAGGAVGWVAGWAPAGLGGSGEPVVSPFDGCCLVGPFTDCLACVVGPFAVWGGLKLLCADFVPAASTGASLVPRHAL